jgi:hypothetical protein
LRYCIACKEEIPADADVCPNCAANMQQTHAESLPSKTESLDFEEEPAPDQAQPQGGRIWIIASITMLLGLAAAYYFVFLQDDVASKGGVPSQTTAAPAAAQAEPVTLYAVTRANIRDMPSTSGSSITGTLARGTAATGQLKAGQSAEDNWLELADGAGFISAVNLSETAPPQIIKPLGDKIWKTDSPTDIWASAGGGDLIDRVSKDTSITLVGLVAGDYIEIKLRSGGVGYIAGGARIIALLETPVAPPITMTFRPDSCDFGGGVGALFTQLSRQSDARRAAIENRDYANPDARQAALESYDQKNEGRSIFVKTKREYKGLTITGIGIHSESQSVYFDDPPAKVIAVFRQAGYNMRGNGEFQTSELYAGIGPAAKQDRNYGNSYLNCGV